LIKVYFLTLLLFVVAKAIFMLANQEEHAFSANDVWEVITHGLTLDLSTSLYILIVPFLITVISAWWDKKVLSHILRGYYIIIATGLVLAFVADTSLYPFWGYKLDASCLQYFETPAEMRASVSGPYLSIRLILLVIGTIVVYQLYKHIPLWHKAPSSKHGITLVNVLLIPLFVIGIRGGLDESTTNIGQVYYSQDQFLNHSAVNPVFSFLSSFEKTASANIEYKFYEKETCDKIMSDLYPTKSVGIDPLLNTDRPNVVVILLESCGNVFTQAMPNFNKLKNEGIWFENCYGNSYRTDRGTVCTLSGYPSFPTMSVMKMPKKTAQLPSIAKTLQKEGYNTSYLYGGDINFTNMRSYLIGTGWQKLYWKADYTNEEQNSAKWGVRDDITFSTLYNQIRNADPTERFLMGYSTLSSHEPWDVPTQKYKDEKLNAFYYLDQCIGDFVEKIKATTQWKDLLIIMLPDHGINYKDLDETRQERNHIPMLWIGGAVKAPRMVMQLCNQTDLPATLLGQMSLKHDDFTFSRDILSQNYQKPFAMHCYNNGFSIVDSIGFTVFDLTSEKAIVGSDTKAIELGKAILQTTSKDLKDIQ